MTEMEIKVEIEVAHRQKIVCRLQQSIHDKFHFRTKIEAVALGTLPIFEMKAKRWIRL